jgi:predicted PurR-regulated permease PerM
LFREEEIEFAERRIKKNILNSLLQIILLMVSHLNNLFFMRFRLFYFLIKKRDSQKKVFLFNYNDQERKI